MKNILTHEDLNFLPNYELINYKKIPNSIKNFKEWFFNSDEIDFLNDWPF